MLPKKTTLTHRLFWSHTTRINETTCTTRFYTSSSPSELVRKNILAAPCRFTHPRLTELPSQLAGTAKEDKDCRQRGRTSSVSVRVFLADLIKRNSILQSLSRTLSEVSRGSAGLPLSSPSTLRLVEADNAERIKHAKEDGGRKPALRSTERKKLPSGHKVERVRFGFG